MSRTDTQPSHYRPDIDGLRAFAVCAVVLFHVLPVRVPQGYLGVDIFFVISGFLITGIVLDELRARTFRLSTFYLRRARRILPALLSMLLLVLPLALLVLMPDELEAFARSLLASLAFVPNIALWKEAGYFDTAAWAKPLLHLWSLGVEEQFYLAWPLALMLIARYARPLAIPALTAAIALLSFGWHLHLAQRWPDADFYLPFTRMWELLLGGLLAMAPSARIPAAGQAGAGGDASMNHLLSASGLLLMLIGIAGVSTSAEAGAFTRLTPTAGAAMFIAAGNDGFFNRVVFSRRVVVYLGLISYPLYLWHWPLLSFVGILRYDNVWLNHGLRIGAVAASVALAAATYHLVERRVRRRPDLRRLAARLAAGVALGAIIGVLIILTDGLPGRTQAHSDPFAWSMDLRADPACIERYMPRVRTPESAYCLRNHAEGAPQIVVIGDSHANALWPGISAAFQDQPALQIGGPACPYLTRTRLDLAHGSQRAADCPSIMDAAYAAVGTDTRLIILTARDASYAEADSGLQSLDLPGASPASIYEATLTRDLARLLADHREVVVVLPTPEFDRSPRDCVPFRPLDRWVHRVDAGNCRVERAIAERRRSRYRAELDRAVRALHNPDLRVVDPFDALCDSRDCYSVIDGVPAFRDQQHLSRWGSRFLWPRIEPPGLRARPAGTRAP